MADNRGKKNVLNVPSTTTHRRLSSQSRLSGQGQTNSYGEMDDYYEKAPSPQENLKALLIVNSSTTESDLNSVTSEVAKSSVTTMSDSTVGPGFSGVDFKRLAQYRDRCFHAVRNYFGRVFTFPLITKPISFERPPDEQPGQQLLTPADLEELVNLDPATKERFDRVYKERKVVKEAAEKFNYKDVDLSQFPKWDKTVIDRLKTTFAVFDATGDNLIDQEEFSTVLNEFGDKTSEEVRVLVFNSVDVEKSGVINFEQFITLVYNLTVDRKFGDGSSNEVETIKLGESLRMIDHNMTRIRSLDVVQQLQAGLF